MNPLTKVRLINELNEREASLGIKDSVSWHAQYKNSAWVFIGGFPFELTEGDIICVFSQYGEIANINLVRDKKTGKSKGFCFLCYEDQRSTILAVDNFNGIKIKGRTLRVDHVENYRPPKDSEDIDDVTKRLREGGCAPKLPSSAESESEDEYLLPTKKSKKDKKEKKKKEKKEKKKAVGMKRNDTQGDSSSPVRVKKERDDAGYEKYVLKEEPREERVGQRDRMDEMDRYKDMHENSRRTDRVRDREEGKGKDDLLPRQKRERYRESEREKDKHRNREHETKRNRNRDRENEREKERSRDKARDCERERDKDRQKERDGERAGKHREKDRGRDQEREADRGYTKHIHD